MFCLQLREGEKSIKWGIVLEYVSFFFFSKSHSEVSREMREKNVVKKIMSSYESHDF